MENAGKADIPDEAERKGLGTPATRADIIEKLVSAGFVERKGKNLIPTKAGMNLVTILPEPLTSPMLTAEWEQRLTSIARGEADPGEFMDGFCAMVKDTVSTYSHISEEGQKLFAPDKEVIGNCPRCGKPVYEGKSNFACPDRSCSFVLWKNDRFWTSRKKEMTKKMAADLLKKGSTAVKGMWSEKKGDTYDATVILEDTGVYELELLAAAQASPFKLTTAEQFKEFAANTDYFVFEPIVRDLNDLGLRFIAQHTDILLTPELLNAIDPVPFGQYAAKEEQGYFTEHGYISLSGDEWQHEKGAEHSARDTDKKPSIRERLEQGKKECAAKQTPTAAKGKNEQEL